VLAGAGLRDDPLLPEPHREERLPHRVVDLVRAGVVQVLALEQDPAALAQALGGVERRGAADVRRLERVELGAEARVVLDRVPARDELVERRDERLGDVAPAVRAVETVG
jgi:hypothetical protein